MENEAYESLSHWGMFKVDESVTICHQLPAFVPLSAYKERIDTIPKVEVVV